MKYPTLKLTGIKNKPFALAQPFNIKLSNGDNMHIFKGYWTDFASVPRWLKLFIDHIGIDTPAFICHDYMYNFGGYTTQKLEDDYIEKRVQRKFADQEMRYQMQQYGAGKLRVFLFYWAVRLGGWTSYRTL